MEKRPHKDTAALTADLAKALGQEDAVHPRAYVRKAHTQLISNTERKRKQRKLKYLQDKRRKTDQRAALMRSIIDHSQLTEEVKEVLVPSSELGQQGTLKARLKRELKRRKLGMTPAEDVPLEVEIRPVSPEPEPIKKPCFQPQQVFVPSPEPSVSDQESWNQSSSEAEAESAQHPIVPQNLDLEVLAGYKSAPDSDPSRHKLYIQVQRSPEIQASRSELPILSMEREVTEAIMDHPFTIICGATGSGKSTQVPQFLYEIGFSHTASPFPGRIGVTQPRRVAAMTLAQRVSDELGLVFGQEVGYQIRFDVHTISPEKNHIKFMTDGILLKEIETDFLLSAYSVIIIDEAHERSVNTDVLLGMLARIVPLRSKMSEEKGAKTTPLKVIIMSATLRVDDFIGNSRLFPTPPPVVNVEARQYPVSMHYTKVTDQADYLELAYKKVVKIHRNLPPGGILVFLTGKRDVDHLRAKLKYALKGDSAVILPLYSMLSPKKQLRVFENYPSKRLIVISTNIAETSLTIPTVKYVVDCGLEKRKVYAGKLQMSAFIVDWIAKASADQRAGRAGRLSPGHCYRLYTLAAYNGAFAAFKPPQILTTPIEGTILLLKSMGIKDVTKFPFPTSPDEAAVKAAIDQLLTLGALQRISPSSTSPKVDNCTATAIGRDMARLPISPRYAKMLVLSQRYNIPKLMSLTAAALSMEQVFTQEIKDEEGKVSKAAVKKQHSKWQNAKSDAIGLLNLCIVYFSDRQKAVEKGQFEENFCREHNINIKSMREIGELSCQLLSEVTSEKVTLDSHFGDISVPTPEEYDSVLKCIIGGFIDRVAMADPDPEDSWKASKRVPYLTSEHLDLSLCSEEYKAACPNKEYVFIHPSSYLFGRSSPALIVYQDLIFTSKPYMRCITAVQAEWLLELGGHLVQPYSPLPVPPPSVVQGGIKCWVEPAFGPKCWRLEAMLVDFPLYDQSLYLWLLRFLMEGKLAPDWGDIKDFWTVKTGNVTNPAASGTQKSIGKAISLLRSHSITSLHSLQSTPPVLSRLRKALEPLLVPSQKARFSALWAHLS